MPASSMASGTLPGPRAAGDRGTRTAAADLRRARCARELIPRSETATVARTAKPSRRCAAAPARCSNASAWRLNFLQRLSGVATLARQFADAVAGTELPRARYAQDHARSAPAGKDGGRRGRRHQSPHGPVRRDSDQEQPHRRGRRRAQRHRARARDAACRFEIEVRTRAKLHEALDAGADHLLLDNLTPGEAAEWVREIAGRAKVELSGGITLENVRAYAETGADFVSSGAITHSARAMDISFRLELLMNWTIHRYSSVDSTMRVAAPLPIGSSRCS